MSPTRIEPSALGKVSPCSTKDHFANRLYYSTKKNPL